EVELAELVAANLRRSGFAVDHVGLAEEARAAVEFGRYEIVLLDLRLPDGDGFNLIRWLRMRGTGGRQERGYLREVDRFGTNLGILVCSPTLSLADTLRWMRDETLVELVPVLTPLFLGTLVIAPLTIRRSLTLIDRLSAEVALIEPNRTDLRLAEDSIPSE